MRCRVGIRVYSDVQYELSSRDKSILKLQYELDTAQQKYQGSLEAVRKEKRQDMVRMKLLIRDKSILKLRCRDKSILKLQSELDTTQQLYQGSLEEVRNVVSSR